MTWESGWPMRARVATLGLCVLWGATAEAGSPFARRPRRIAPVPASYRLTDTAPPPMLGSFYSTPYMIVRGNFPAGGGYTPMDQYGDTTLALYGPLSPLRATAAPVLTYSRGYDGRPRLSDGTAFSTPNLPELSPVVYPARANTSYYGPRRSGTPPQWENAINWIDQN